MQQISPGGLDETDQVLLSLPAALASASEREVLKVAATHLSQLYPSLGYIRVLLISQNYTPSELLELCIDQRMAAAVAQASTAPAGLAADTGGSSSSSSGINSSSSSSNTSQQAAMRMGMPLHTPQLAQQQQPGQGEYADWRVLQQQFGMQSFAAVPLMAAGTVHGVIVAASATPYIFAARSMNLIEAVANMLAPYAALLYKYQQIKSTRRLLEQLLPPRVVAAAIERLNIGGASVVDVFVPTHPEYNPDDG